MYGQNLASSSPNYLEKSEGKILRRDESKQISISGPLGELELYHFHPSHVSRARARLGQRERNATVLTKRNAASWNEIASTLVIPHFLSKTFVLLLGGIILL